MEKEIQNKRIPISLLRIVTDFYPIQGGSVTHVIELIHKIDPFIAKQTLICPIYENAEYSKFDDEFLVPITRIRYNLIQNQQWSKIPGVSTLNLIFYAYNITKAIIELNKSHKSIDIIHIHRFDLGIIINLFLKIERITIPVVIMTHGNPLNEDVPIRSKLFTIIFRKGILRYFKPNFVLLLDDGTLSDSLFALLQNNNIQFKIVFHAIDTDLYSPLNIVEKKNGFIILSPHRLEQSKRVDLGIVIFEKFFKLLTRPKNLKLKIAGTGSEMDQLKEFVKEMGIQENVLFLGSLSIEDTRNEMLSSDVIIGTSLISNINRSIQEAMACAKPVVIFFHNNKGILTHKENCLISKPGDIEGFVDNLKLLYQNEKFREFLGLNARNTIIQQRSWDFRLKQELEVYQKIISRINK